MWVEWLPDYLSKFHSKKFKKKQTARILQILQQCINISFLKIPIILELQDECFEALESISRKINNNDADMRSHVILSMIKVAAAEADVPDLPPSGSWRLATSSSLSLLVFKVLLIHYVTMSISHMMTSSLYRTCQYL